MSDDERLAEIRARTVLHSAGASEPTYDYVERGAVERLLARIADLEARAAQDAEVIAAATALIENLADCALGWVSNAPDRYVEEARAGYMAWRALLAARDGRGPVKPDSDTTTNAAIRDLLLRNDGLISALTSALTNAALTESDVRWDAADQLRKETRAMIAQLAQRDGRGPAGEATP